MSKCAQNPTDVRVLVFKSKTNKAGLIARLQDEAGSKNAIQLERDDKAYAPFEEFCKRKDKQIKCGNSDTGVGQRFDDFEEPARKYDDARQNRLLEQHRAAWSFEWSQMEKAADNVASELSEILTGWEEEETEFSELADCQRSVLQDEDEFVAKTIQPVLTLRDDVIFWLSAFELQESYGQGDSEDVLSLITSVRQQQESVMEQLKQELQKIETSSQLAAEQRIPCALQGLPPSLSLDLCPTEELRSELIEEFLLLDVKYQQKLTTVQERFIDIIRLPCDGWNVEDHNTFIHGINFYSATFPNYQELTFDYLQRLFPHISLDELLKHNYWVTRQRQYHGSIAATVYDWHRCKEELFIKANATIAAACRSLQEDANKVITQVYQRKICNNLSEKVVQWRKEKFAKMQLEEDRENEAYFKFKRQQHAEELKQRLAIKTKLMEYHKELEIKQQEELTMYSERMKCLQKKKEDDARYNKVRVRYREANHQIIMQQNKERQISKENEAEQRRQKLDALRRKVAVEAVRNPLRMMQATAAFEAKRKHVFEMVSEIPLMKPLYEVYGFNEQQISADSRVRLETKLREAGLLHLPYAQDALRQLPPPTVPRRDMKSTIRFGDL